MAYGGTRPTRLRAQRRILPGRLPRECAPRFRMDAQREVLREVVVSAKKSLKVAGLLMLGFGLVAALATILLGGLLLVWLSVILFGLACAATALVVVVRMRAFRTLVDAGPQIVWVHGSKIHHHFGSPLVQPLSTSPFASTSLTFYLRDGDALSFLVPGSDLPKLLDDLGSAFPRATLGYSDALLEAFVRNPGSLEKGE